MKSMTGYGKVNHISPDFEIEIEIKSLNHRFLELRVQQPRELNFLELKIRERISKRIKRAKMDVRVNINDKRLPQIELDENRLKAYYDLFMKAKDLLNVKNEISLEEIMKEPGIIQTKQDSIEDSEFVTIIMDLLEQAIDDHQKMAIDEGENMQDFFVTSLTKMDSALSIIEMEFPEYKNEVFQNLKQHITDLISEGIGEEDHKKIMMEGAVYIEKADVNEEIVRLKSHINKFRERMYKNDIEIGKSLNFILQEMHREVNTIGSKFSHPNVFNSIISIKEEIEKCREMVQNVE